MSSSEPQLDERSIRKVATLSLVGASVEWFDFFLYGTAAALVFPKLFFPNADPAVGVLLSFATFGVGFVARPVGGVIWGHFGDRVGRKKAFLAALLTMAAGSVLIGLMPTYAAIGVAAPILLTVLRFVQGLAVGGQWGGAVLLATEFAPPGKRGLYGSVPQIGVPIGVLMGTVAYFFLSLGMSAEAFQSYGWRIPFVASVVLVAVAVYAHNKLEETPAFLHLQKLAAQRKAEGIVSKSPVIEVLRTSWSRILLAGGAFTVVNTTFYIYITFSQDYAVRILHMPKTTVLMVIAIVSLIQIPALAGFAAMSDRVGRRTMYLAGAVGTGLWAFPLFWFIDTGTGWGLTLGLLGGQLTLSMMYGPIAAFFAEMFTARLRYSGASMGYQLGALFGGAVSSVIASWLFTEFGSNVPISLYIILVSVIAVGCTLALSETYQHDMDDAEDAVTSR
ncbi:MFS transporter [Pseudonocardia spinosispora]|uniref:MFS transporter n=1 Tax=Pseudonocardia spinosispora TaxID=103441 RepID=UPI0003FDCDD9|nr:MFS transporter [Pseudonocardia spinosispora]